MYNSVGFSDEEAASTWEAVQRDALSHTSNECTSHYITANDVRKAIGRMKKNKHDGTRGLYSDHLKNSTNALFAHISSLFSRCLLHGFSPPEFGISVLMPIPKSARKSKSDPDNYRSIALSSILNKALDFSFSIGSQEYVGSVFKIRS